MPVVPHRFLFRFKLPVRRHEPPTKSKQFLDLMAKDALPDFGGLDAEHPSFARLLAGWCDDGLGMRVEVAGKKAPVTEAAGDPPEWNGLHLWIDTRNTQSVHRATKFCHRFAFSPGPRRKEMQAVAIAQLSMALAKEQSAATRIGMISAIWARKPDGYSLDLFIPADCLTGWEPESNPLLGFYVVVRDDELGEQFLTVDREFPFDHDPSLWSTLELTR